MMNTQLVKVNNSGRITLIVSASMKSAILYTLERGIKRHRKTLATTNDNMIAALLEEVYLKYYTVLHLDRVNRLLVSKAQAYAMLIAYCEQFHVGTNPQSANLMMQLDQKLK